MDLIPDIPIPTQNKLIPDPILTPAKSGINTALLLSSLPWTSEHLAARVGFGKWTGFVCILHTP